MMWNLTAWERKGAWKVQEEEKGQLLPKMRFYGDGGLETAKVAQLRWASPLGCSVKTRPQYC